MNTTPHTHYQQHCPTDIIPADRAVLFPDRP
jgi:hypothetical protein